MTLFEMTLSLDGGFAFILCPIIYVCKNAFLFRGYLRLFCFQHWTRRYDKKRKVSSLAFFFVWKGGLLVPILLCRYSGFGCRKRERMLTPYHNIQSKAPNSDPGESETT